MKSTDDIIKDWNDQAKAEGRLLDKCFWEVPRSPGSILERPETPEAEERIRKVAEEIERLRDAAPAPPAVGTSEPRWK